MLKGEVLVDRWVVRTWGYVDKSMIDSTMARTSKDRSDELLRFPRAGESLEEGGVYHFHARPLMPTRDLLMLCLSTVNLSALFS